MNTLQPLSANTHRTAWVQALAGLLCLAVALGIGRFLLTPLLPVMHGVQHIDLVLAGWLASATNIGYLAGALACAMIPVRSLSAIRYGLLLVAVFTAVMGITDNAALWLAARLLIGIASAYVVVHAAALITPRLHRLQRSDLDGVFYAGVGISIVLAGWLVPHFAARAVGPASLWWWATGIAALLLIPVWLLLDEGSPIEHAAAAHRAAPGAGAPALIAMYGLAGFGYAIPATFMPVIARRLLHAPQLADALWPLYGAASALVTVALPHLSRRGGSHRRGLVFCLLSMLAGTLVLLTTHNIAALVAAALLMGGPTLAIVMLTMREAHRIAGHNTAVLAAWLTSAFGVGQIAGPLLAGYAAELSGSFSAPLAVAAAALLAGAGAMLLPERRRAALGAACAD